MEMSVVRNLVEERKMKINEFHMERILLLSSASTALKHESTNKSILIFFTLLAFPSKAEFKARSTDTKGEKRLKISRETI
jgi:hypothetical protein